MVVLQVTVDHVLLIFLEDELIPSVILSSKDVELITVDVTIAPRLKMYNLFLSVYRR